jgi:predicted lipid-binding transport protein (Tim44 family)
MMGRIPQIKFGQSVSQRERDVCGQVWQLTCKDCKTQHDMKLVLSESADEADLDSEEPLNHQSAASPVQHANQPSPASSRSSPVIPPAASTVTPQPEQQVENVVSENVIQPKKRGSHSNYFIMI